MVVHRRAQAFARARLPLLLVFVILVEPLLRFLAITHNSHIDIRFKTPFILDYIAYGALLSVLIHLGRIRSSNLRALGRSLVSAGGLGVALTLFLRAFHPSNGLVALETVPWMWLVAGLLLLGLRRDLTRATATREETHAPGLLGFFAYISYGLYLIDPFINLKLDPHLTPFLLAYGITNLPLACLKLLIACSIAVLLAYLSRRYFEEAALQLKHRIIAARTAA